MQAVFRTSTSRKEPTNSCRSPNQVVTVSSGGSRCAARALPRGLPSVFSFRKMEYSYCPAPGQALLAVHRRRNRYEQFLIKTQLSQYTCCAMIPDWLKAHAWMFGLLGFGGVAGAIIAVLR